MCARIAFALAALILLLALPSCRGDVAAPPRIHSAATLSTPPSLTSVNDYNGLSYCIQSSTNAVIFFSNDGPAITVPGVGNLASLIVERGPTSYLLIASIDSAGRTRLYRYHDSDEDGIPDQATQLQLLDLGSMPTFVTSVTVLGNGTTYLLDARCQDILIATDTDNDGWPDAIATTPFAMSDSFEDLLQVKTIRAAAVGDVRGAISSLSQGDLLRRGSQALVTRFRDTNADNIADSGAFETQEVTTLRVFGVPASGHQEILVSATAGHTVVAFALNEQLLPTAQLGSVVVTNEPWSGLALSRPLALGEWILVRSTSSPGESVRWQVWTARSQIAEASEPVVDLAGGIVLARGLDLDENMEMVLVTADGVERDLDFQIEDGRSATVTIPPLPASAEGLAHLIVRDPDQPDEPTAVQLHINDLESGS